MVGRKQPLSAKARRAPLETRANYLFSYSCPHYPPCPLLYTHTACKLRTHGIRLGPTTKAHDITSTSISTCQGHTVCKPRTHGDKTCLATTKGSTVIRTPRIPSPLLFPPGFYNLGATFHGIRIPLVTTKARTGIHTLPPFCPPSLLYPLATGMQPASHVSNGNRVPLVIAEAYTVIPPLPPSPGRLLSVFLQHSACHLSDFENDPRAHKEIKNKLRPRFAAWPLDRQPSPVNLSIAILFIYRFKEEMFTWVFFQSYSLASK